MNETSETDATPEELALIASTPLGDDFMLRGVLCRVVYTHTNAPSIAGARRCALGPCPLMASDGSRGCVPPNVHRSACLHAGQARPGWVRRVVPVSAIPRLMMKGLLS